MSGIVNTTGAVSGVVGTTVGTVTAEKLSGVLPVGVTGGSGLISIPSSQFKFVRAEANLDQSAYKHMAGGFSIPTSTTYYLKVRPSSNDDIAVVYIMMGGISAGLTGLSTYFGAAGGYWASTSWVNTHNYTSSGSAHLTISGLSRSTGLVRLNMATSSTRAFDGKYVVWGMGITRTTPVQVDSSSSWS
jgi:hypothetical protein